MTRIFFKIIAFIICYLFFATQVFAFPVHYNAFTVKVSGNGQPMLLIPGATCSSDEWNETVARYAGKYQCHAFTLAGYAGTPALPSGPYLVTMKNQVEQYIKDNNLQNVILVGHSIGGVLAMWIASEMKDNLQKVVIVDAMPFFALTSNPAAKDSFSEMQAQAMYDRYRQMDENTLRNMQLMNAKFMCIDSARWSTIVNWGLASDRKTMAYTITEMLSKDLRKTIAHIQAPALVLAAYTQLPEYPAYTRDMVMQTYTGQYKDCNACTIHVAEGKTKHFIMYDDPNWFFSEMDTFIAKK